MNNDTSYECSQMVRDEGGDDTTTCAGERAASFSHHLPGLRLLSDACFNGKHTGQSFLVQFFQWEMICLEDAQ